MKFKKGDKVIVSWGMFSYKGEIESIIHFNYLGSTTVKSFMAYVDIKSIDDLKRVFRSRIKDGKTLYEVYDKNLRMDNQYYREERLKELLGK